MIKILEGNRRGGVKTLSVPGVGSGGGVRLLLIAQTNVQLSLTNRWIIPLLSSSSFFVLFFHSFQIKNKYVFFFLLSMKQFAGIPQRSMVSLNDPMGIWPTIPSIRTVHSVGHLIE